MSQGGGQFTSNLRPRWTDPVTARRVPSKQKGIRKGSKGSKGDQQLEIKKARGMRHYMQSVPVYIMNA